jgi:hypothetical protein
MAAEASRAPIAVRERPVAPDLERPTPIINSVTGALDNVTCAIERLRVLFNDALGELHDLSVASPVNGGTVNAAFSSRLSDNWLIFEVVSGLLVDVEAIVGAINEKAHAERRAVAA